jgi:uncharacterized protein YcbK (DUF882 family)
MEKISDLTDNFGRWEFFVSEEHPELARISQYMRDVGKVDDRLYLLCKLILQPVRDFIGEPVMINSGFRSNDLNLAIGGTEKSLHLRAKAADFTVVGEILLESCYEFIRDELEGRYCELFYYKDRGFIHVALADIFKKSPKVGIK